MDNKFLELWKYFLFIYFEEFEILKGNANGIIVSFPFFMSKFLKFHYKGE